MGAPKNSDDVRPDAEIIAALRDEIDRLETDRAGFDTLAKETAKTTSDLRVRLSSAERDLAGARTQRDEALLQVQRAMGYIDRILESEREEVPPAPHPIYNYAPAQNERGPRLSDSRLSVPF